MPELDEKNAIIMRNEASTVLSMFRDAVRALNGFHDKWGSKNARLQRVTEADTVKPE